MDQPVLLVEGFGRCGTSMMMRMLDHGGITCVGSYPDYEDERIMSPPAVRDPFYRSIAGKALKVLDPHRVPPPKDIHALVIWLDRDPIEQAKSTLIFMSHMMPGLVNVSRRGIKILSKSYAEDRPKAHKAGLGSVSPLLIMRFENIIQSPEQAATDIGTFLSPWFSDFDIARAAAQVHRRSPQCLDRPMELEYA